MKHGLLATLTLALLAGCDGNSEAPSPPTAKAEPGPAPAKADAPKAEAKPEPKEAPPKTAGPPESFEALAAGSPAPAMTKLAATTGAWSRADKPTIVAFYRGHW
ncbi:MAG: hypothetical protein AAGA54_01945 [Myxococcota bacterium]